jgi:glucokinase
MQQLPTVPGGPGLTPGALFQLFRDGRAHTRSELVQATGLSRSAVNARIDALVHLRILDPVGEGQSTGGRPSSQFAFDAHGHVVLGVDVGASHVSVGLVDLSGRVLGFVREEMDIRLGPEPVLRWVVEHGQELISGAASPKPAVLGVGVGVPGPVDFASGRPVSPPIMPGWDDFPIADVLGESFGVPVVVDNDVNVLALAEHQAFWSTTDDMLFVKAATGIGSGIIAGGLVQRGALGAAGDLGHIVTDRDSDVRCRCGNRGCLEAIASASALAERLIGDAPSAVEALIEAARTGDLRVGSEVREAGRRIGEVVASVVSMLNPAVVVIGGSLTAAGEPFLAGVRESVYGHALPLATRDLILTESRLGDRGGVRGASALSADTVLSALSIDSRMAAHEARAI